MNHNDFTVMTINFNHGGVDDGDPSRFHKILDLIGECGVDVALVQEMLPDDTRIAEAESRLDATCVMAPDGAGHNRTAVLLRSECVVRGDR